MTHDGSRDIVRLALHRRLSPLMLVANRRLRPVRIARGALGCGLPRRDLLVSPQHRLLVRSSIAARMFGDHEVLVPARKLVGLPGIDIDPAPEGVIYVHLVLATHRILLAEGAPSESLLLAPGGLAALPDAAREELGTLFPELNRPDFKARPAALIPKGKRLKKLIARHRQNRKPPLMAA